MILIARYSATSQQTVAGQNKLANTTRMSITILKSFCAVAHNFLKILSGFAL